MDRTMNAPSVSVIVAAYNYGRYIGETLRSVQAQTLQEWECIVVDDASTDDTASVVAGYATQDPRIRLVRFTQNQGVSAARNTGLQQSRGTYIQFLDADDLIAPRKLERQVSFLASRPDVAIVYSDHVRFTDQADLKAPGLLRADERVHGRAALRRAIKSNFLRLNAVLFRSSLLKDIGGFREQFRYAEDWDFWLRAMANGHSVHFLNDDQAKAAVRNTPGSLSKDLPAMRSFHLPVRQSLWASGRLTLMERMSLLVRSVDFLMEMVVVERERVIVLKEGRWSFFPLVVIVALFTAPLWLLLRFFVRR